MVRTWIRHNIPYTVTPDISPVFEIKINGRKSTEKLRKRFLDQVVVKLGLGGYMDKKQRAISRTMATTNPRTKEEEKEEEDSSIC